ncbi:MAG: peptidase M22 [Actinomycetia bacterium]|nr:peptidase M22 [Actinomycetes bacterium]
MRGSRGAVLGLDTSAYTASVALVDGRRVVREARRVAEVPPGGRGLRPSEAFFQHVVHLPALVAEVRGDALLAGIAVSARPRPVPDSYLPPFEAGRAAARLLADALGVPLVETTHQEGHIAAGLVDAGGPATDTFWALHVSGGTTELLAVRRRPPGFAVESVGGTGDLYGGQLVDRVGVRLGLPFPAGPALEALARTARDRLVLPFMAPVQRDGRWIISFSGPEAQAMRAIAAGVEPAAVARAVEDVLARALAALVRAAARPPAPVLVVGGVAANRRLRATLADLLGEAWPLFFASPELSRDNAVGVAWIGWWALGAEGGSPRAPVGERRQSVSVEEAEDDRV